MLVQWIVGVSGVEFENFVRVIKAIVREDERIAILPVSSGGKDLNFLAGP